MKRYFAIAVAYAVIHFTVSFGSMWIAMDLEANWSSPLKAHEDFFLVIATITSLPGLLLVPLLQWLPRGPGVVSPWLYVVYSLNACLWGAVVAGAICSVWRLRKRDPDAVPCSKCGYDLRGSPGGACPECGEGVF